MKSDLKAPNEPKYRQIANTLLREIRQTMGVGAKFPTETSLAERFGLHVLTIRQALRVLQEAGVIQRQRAIGTTVINPLGGNWVSIVCEKDIFSPSSDSLFHRSVIYHLRHFLREAGLPSRVSIGETEPGQSSSDHLTSFDFVADIEANRLAGVLAISTNLAEWWIKKLKKQNVPVVGSNMYFPFRVVFDPWEDLSKALRCLMDLGRRRIAYLGWIERTHDGGIDERLPKALDELEKCYPVTIRKEWIKGDIHPEQPGAGWEEIREIWGANEEKPDGLIIDNEHLLPDVERFLAELGVQVPKDLAIVSHRTRGNHYLPRFPIIFQENDPQIFAHRMAEFFLRLYRGEQVASHTVTVPRLLIESSLLPSAQTLTPP